MTADETNSMEVVKNHGCFWPTEVYKRQKKQDPPKDQLTKYKDKGSKKWIDGVWMYDALDTLVPGAINLLGRQSHNLKKEIHLTEVRAHHCCYYYIITQRNMAAAAGLRLLANTGAWVI